MSGALTVDERDPAHSHVTVTIGTTSLDTKRPARDTHLRSADFFDVARYPSMTFTSQRIEALDQAAGHYRVTGTLTIREISHEVSLDVWHVSPALTEEGRLTLTARGGTKIPTKMCKKPPLRSNCELKDVSVHKTADV